MTTLLMSFPKRCLCILLAILAACCLLGFTTTPASAHTLSTVHVVEEPSGGGVHDVAPVEENNGSGSHGYVYHNYSNNYGGGSGSFSWSGCLLVLVIISLAILWSVVASQCKRRENPDDNSYYRPGDQDEKGRWGGLMK
jgi:hypothetical protein